MLDQNLYRLGKRGSFIAGTIAEILGNAFGGPSGLKGGLTPRNRDY